MDSTNADFKAVTAALDQLRSSLCAQEAQLRQAEDNIKQQVRQLENEKLQMTAANMIDDEVLNLNVGGQHMSVKRSTLTQVDASLLAAMFSGRWEASHIHTSAGHIFLDYSPACFQKIVNYLRLRRCNDVSGAVTARPPLTDLTPDDQHAYHDLVDYLGLTQYMGYVRVAPQPDGGNAQEIGRDKAQLPAKDIELVMDEAGVCRCQAVQALTLSGGDIIGAFMQFPQFLALK